MTCLLWFIYFKKYISVYGKCSKSTNSIGGSRHRDKLHILLLMTLSEALHLASNPRHYWWGTNGGDD